MSCNSIYIRLYNIYNVIYYVYLFYRIPLTSVIIDISNASLPSDESFEVNIICGLDLEGLGINEWSNNKLSSIYEIPSDVTIKMNIKSGNL